MRYTNIIFDFDGTLVDTRPGLVSAFQLMMKDMGVTPADNRIITSLIGVPLAEFVSRLLKTENENTIEKASESFKKHYQNKNIFNNVLHSGIPELLEVIVNNSGKNYIISNKIEKSINIILSQHNIKKYFVYIKGTDGRDTCSKKADYLKSIMRDNNLIKSETVIVGDTKSDIIAGKENGIFTIGITFGYGSRKELESARADIIFNNVEKIKNFLFK